MFFFAPVLLSVALVVSVSRLSFSCSFSFATGLPRTPCSLQLFCASPNILYNQIHSFHTPISEGADDECLVLQVLVVIMRKRITWAEWRV